LDFINKYASIVIDYWLKEFCHTSGYTIHK
jgi:hypothetical protein